MGRPTAAKLNNHNKRPNSNAGENVLESFDVSGDGKDFVTVELSESSAPGREVLVVEALDAMEEDTPEVSLDIFYKNGVMENKKFGIIPTQAQVTFENEEEEGEDGRGNRRGRELTFVRKLWSSWYYYWSTGGSSDQPWYNQFRDAPNNSGCASGCGATGM